MSSTESAPIIDDSPDDEQLFHVLDAYVASLQTGSDAAANIDLPDELVERFPQLAGMLDCLDSLDQARGCWNPEGSTAPESPNDGSAISSLQRDRADAGQPFGDYELLEEIGRGGMGVVYRARHKTLQADVALKLIRSSQLASAEELRRFYQEARVGAGLNHPLIVRVHAVGEHEGQHYLVMDLVDGPNLGTLVQSGAIDPVRSAEIAVDVARCVQHLHECGYIHRDLKPSNVLLDSAGRPHLTDFGLIRLLSNDHRETVSGTIIGTPAYMAPEQARGHSGEIGPLCDVYGIGALMYELLTGRPVHQEESPLDTLLSVLEREPLLPRQFVPSVPIELEQICLKCLEKSPERRYPSAQAVVADLECFLKGEPIQATAPSIGRRLIRWTRRQPALVCRLAGIGIGATIVQISKSMSTAEWPNHFSVMCVLALWAGISFALQRLLFRKRLEGIVPLVWAAVDVTSFTALVTLGEQPRELLLSGYVLLIAGSGLWFRVRLVSFMTVACLLACGWLWISERQSPNLPVHYVGIYLAILIITGCVVAFQVYRIRVLNGYFERQERWTPPQNPANLT